MQTPREIRLLASRIPAVVDIQLDAACESRRPGFKAESHQWVNSTEIFGGVPLRTEGYLQLFASCLVGVKLRLQTVEKLIGQFSCHAANEARSQLSKLAANPTVHVV